MNQAVNLYTEDMRPRRDPLSLNRVAGFALGAFAVIVFAGFYTSWQASLAVDARLLAEARVESLRNQVTTASERLAARTEDPALQAELERLSAAIRGRDELVQRVEQLAARSVEGFSSYLVGLSRQAVEGVWLTALEVDREYNSLALEGLTEDGSLVPLYLEQLRAEPAFAGRRFSHFGLERPEEDAQILHFRVAAKPADQEAGQ